MRYTLKQIGGDVDFKAYDGIFASKQFNNGEFNYWYVLKTYNNYDSMGEEEAKKNGKYTFILSVVAPSQQTEENIKSNFSFYGIDLTDKQIEDIKNEKSEFHINQLLDISTGATIYQDMGNNWKVLFKAVKEEIAKCNIFFGFYMDKYQNRIGSTGWDFIKGDITAGLYKKDWFKWELS